MEFCFSRRKGPTSRGCDVLLNQGAIVVTCNQLAIVEGFLLGSRVMAHLNCVMCDILAAISLEKVLQKAVGKYLWI